MFGIFPNSFATYLKVKEFPGAHFPHEVALRLSCSAIRGLAEQAMSERKPGVHALRCARLHSNVDTNGSHFAGVRRRCPPFGEAIRPGKTGRGGRPRTVLMTVGVKWSQVEILKPNTVSGTRVSTGRSGFSAPGPPFHPYPLGVSDALFDGHALFSQPQRVA